MIAPGVSAASIRVPRRRISTSSSALPAWNSDGMQLIKNRDWVQIVETSWRESASPRWQRHMELLNTVLGSTPASRYQSLWRFPHRLRDGPQASRGTKPHRGHRHHRSRAALNTRHGSKINLSTCTPASRFPTWATPIQVRSSIPLQHRGRPPLHPIQAGPAAIGGHHQDTALLGATGIRTRSFRQHHATYRRPVLAGPAP